MSSEGRTLLVGIDACSSINILGDTGVNQSLLVQEAIL